MGAVNTLYQQPGVTFTSLSSQATSQGPGPNGVLCILGTSVQGSNKPRAFASLADCINEYGSASANSANGYNLEQALEIAFAQTGSTSQLQVRTIRVGATNAAVSVPQNSGGQTAYSLVAQAEYAGQNNVVAVVGTSTYNSAQGSFYQTMSVYNGPIATATLVENYTAFNPQSMTDQINSQSSIVNCSTAGGSTTASSNSFGATGNYTLTGALTGQNATDTDYLNALNNLATTIDCDFIVAMSGSPGVQQGLFSHAVAMAAVNKFREAFIGNKYTGAQVAAVVNSAVATQSLISSRYACLLANTGGYRVNPVSQLQQVYDGFYWTAALGAIKAVSNAGDPITRKSINGLIGLTETFSSQNFTTLGSYGILSLALLNNAFVTYDGLTLADYPSPYRKENISAAENKLALILLSQVGTLIGTADPYSDVNLIKQTTQSALNFAQQQHIIVSWDATALSVTSTSVGVFTVTVVYQPRVEISNINFQLQLNLTVGI